MDLITSVDLTRWPHLSAEQKREVGLALLTIEALARDKKMGMYKSLMFDELPKDIQDMYKRRAIEKFVR